MEEYWLTGPVPDIPSLLQPVAHALLQARREITEMLIGFPEEKRWQKPYGMASVAFHLQHLAGVLDRLFTYADGKALNKEQLAYLAAEGKENFGLTIKVLLKQFILQTDKALGQLRNTKPETLTDTRFVGRKQLPSTVMGLLFHAAEHTMRHTGQLLVTVTILKA